MVCAGLTFRGLRYGVSDTRRTEVTRSAASSSSTEAASRSATLAEEMTAAPRAILLNEIRYAERLCQRTARLYRRIQTFGGFVAVVSGSAVLSALSAQFAPWVSLGGAVCLTVLGAILLTVRPGDKAAAAEADQKRYSALRAQAMDLDDEALQRALNKTREGDSAEIESLRDVAYNDLVVEVGRPEHLVPLTPLQRLLALMA